MSVNLDVNKSLIKLIRIILTLVLVYMASKETGPFTGVCLLLIACRLELFKE
jgi:hypothetical protein